jgi:hypothetical protein
MVPAQSMSTSKPVQLDADRWHEYFRSVAVEGEGLVATVTLLPDRPADRDSIVAWTLHSIRYDSEADEIEIHLGQLAPRGAILRYFVSAPRSIQVHEWGRGKTISVEDSVGVRTLIQLAPGRDRVMRDLTYS